MKHSFKTLISMWILFAFFACNRIEKETGEAVVSGSLVNHSREAIADSSITLHVDYPIFEQQVSYSSKLQPDGSFSLNIPVLYPVYVLLNTSWGSYQILVTPEEETSLKITKSENGKTEIEMLKGKMLSKADQQEIQKTSWEVQETMMEGTNAEPFEPDVDPNVYRDYMLRKIEKDIAAIDRNANLSEDLKKQMKKLMRLGYFLAGSFNYGEAMYMRHLNLYPDEKTTQNEFPVKNPELSYFSFLAHFDLNRPGSLMPSSYAKSLQALLKDSVLNIPDIGDTPVEEWIGEAKVIFSDLIGFDDGDFYDLLAANAYVKQFNVKLKPLSDIQKENIASYFKTPSYALLLSEENDKIEKVASVIANPTPDVPKEELLAAIVSKYKGKVLFFDFWATWCTPCLNAMNESQSLKKSLAGEDIVFVYIAEYSSAETVWKRQVLEVEGGEHYYLNEENWQYLMNSLGAKGIPFYLLFDKEGKQVDQFVGYPGNETVKKLILELLHGERE